MTLVSVKAILEKAIQEIKMTSVGDLLLKMAVNEATGCALC